MGTKLVLILTCVVGTAIGGNAQDSIFETSIKPIFDQKCATCHNATDLEGGLDLTSVQGLLKGGENGKIIRWDDLNDSPLLEQIVSKSMPPKDAKPLTKKEGDSIRNWFDSGAKFKNKIVSAKITQERIIPLIHLRCVKCHGASKQEAGLDLRTVESMKRGGKSGPAVVAGNSQESLIVQKILAEQMPPRKRIVPDSVKTMTPSELKILCNWIDQGMPRALKRAYQVHTSKADRDFWSFKTPTRSGLPRLQNPDNVINEIDSFVLARLESQGLGFSRQAPREVMIRRLYFDLVGLPPGRDDIQSFLDDNRAGAYERLVDRVLLSPEFGEKWASHWLDAAGYADSEGGQNADRVRNNMWHYRDYVIQSFSRDKPFNQFLVEQLAGDELHDYENEKMEITEEIYESLAATGFLRTTPDRTFQDITNFVPDRLDVIADEIQVLGSAILGMTINCSRCHAHKFDPIPQQDYYRLSSIFKDAYDEHDWLKPENRNLEIPTTRLAGDMPSYVLKSAKEGKISIRALWSRGRPSPSYLLLRGNPLTPGEKVEPNIPEFALTSIGPSLFQADKIQHQTQKSGRRLAFAKWITSKSHPLTSRVFVNRIWYSLFGKGIVATLDNFGKTGTKPSHPKLLDYLAVQLIDDAWSVKQLVRRMVTSRAYRQSSMVQRKTLEKDPDNELFSRMPLKRLSAETVRDSILRVTRQLSSHKFGMPHPVEEQENGLILSKQLPAGGWSRSIYVIHRRSQIPTIMESFDYPQMGPNCIARKTSIVPQQALHLTNNAQVHAWCESLAKNLQKEFNNDFRRMISELCISAFGKQPSVEEIGEYREYFDGLNQRWSKDLSLPPTDQKVQKKSLATICHTLINSAQFLYTD